MPRNPKLIVVQTALRPETLAALVKHALLNKRSPSRCVLVRDACERMVRQVCPDPISLEEVEQLLSIVVQERQRIEVDPPKTSEELNLENLAAQAASISDNIIFPNRWKNAPFLPVDEQDYPANP